MLGWRWIGLFTREIYSFKLYATRDVLDISGNVLLLQIFRYMS